MTDFVKEVQVRHEKEKNIVTWERGVYNWVFEENKIVVPLAGIEKFFKTRNWNRRKWDLRKAFKFGHSNDY